MKQLTDTEKQEFEAKIKDERERQRTLRMNPNRPAVSTEVEFTFNLLWRYGFLALILCLLVFNVMHLLKWRNFGYDQYGNLMIALMLLFNYIAYSLTTKGWKSVVIKTVAWVWIVLIFVYLFWIT
ncbi:MAG: hypothetical protein OXH00_07830 [Candidatus Poribacteria bacterium]|nr:hypothetical protein [Candidatus Poribacteria bacterium]